MSIRDFLKTLDINQLERAKEFADQLIAEKAAETKHLVWTVGDDYVDDMYFPKDAYVKAAEYLLETAKNYQAGNTPERNRKLILGFVLVPESSLPEYFSGEHLKSYFPDPT